MAETTIEGPAVPQGGGSIVDVEDFRRNKDVRSAPYFCIVNSFPPVPFI